MDLSFPITLGFKGIWSFFKKKKIPEFHSVHTETEKSLTKTTVSNSSRIKAKAIGIRYVPLEQERKKDVWIPYYVVQITVINNSDLPLTDLNIQVAGAKLYTKLESTYDFINLAFTAEGVTVEKLRPNNEIIIQAWTDRITAISERNILVSHATGSIKVEIYE